MQLFIAVILSILIGMTEVLHPLKVSMKGVVVNKGKIMIAIYREGQQFPGEICAYKKELPVNNGPTQTLSVQLPMGRYAISVFQDLNNDRKLNTNFLGIPTEPYGFSITRGNFGPPSFEKASFQVPDFSEIEIEIN